MNTLTVVGALEAEEMLGVAGYRAAPLGCQVGGFFVVPARVTRRESGICRLQQIATDASG